MALFRALDAWLNASTQRRAPSLLTDRLDDLMDRRAREGTPEWRTR